jgi:hypothetical protein
MQDATRSEIRRAARTAVQTAMSQTRYPRIALFLLLIVVWVVLDRREPFRSHFGLTLLGSGVSAIIGGLVVYWLSPRKHGPVADGQASTR